MNKNKLINLLCPIVFLAFGIFILVSASSMSKRDSVFPSIVAYITIIISIIQFVVDVRKKDHKNPFENSNLLRVIECIVVMYAYVFLIKRIGFFIDTLLLTMATMIILEYKNIKVMVFSSVIITAAVFAIFKFLLKVPLPTIWM